VLVAEFGQASAQTLKRRAALFLKFLFVHHIFGRLPQLRESEQENQIRPALRLVS
jgi:hypothetical protein